MRSTWLAVVVVLVAGCATKAIPSSQARPVPADRIHAPDFTHAREGLAMLVVTRDKGLRASLCTAALYVDGIRVADIRHSEQIRLFVDEGQHLVGVATKDVAEGNVCFGGEDQTQVDVTSARPALLRIRAGTGEGIRIEPSAF